MGFFNLKNVLIIILTLGIIATIIIFISSTGILSHDFSNRGIYQVRDIKVIKNEINSAEVNIAFSKSTFENIRSSYRILNDNELVYDGEKQIVDNTLGKYRIEIILNDTGLQENFFKVFGLETNKLNVGNNELLRNIRVTFPPDDSMMIIYLGCEKPPKVKFITQSFNIVLNIST